MDCHRKVVPTGHAFVGIMKYFGLCEFIKFREQVEQRFCQIAGISWCANLILHHAKFFSFFPQPYHRFHKVAAIFGVEPGGAHHHAFLI